jgi:hypothetical protein
MKSSISAITTSPLIHNTGIDNISNEVNEGPSKRKPISYVTFLKHSSLTKNLSFYKKSLNKLIEFI